MKKFTVNGNEYEAREIDFNFLSEFNELGLDINILGANYASYRAYLALCAGISLNEAGDMLTQHVINGGDLTGITEILNEVIDESDFISALLKRQDSKTTKGEEESEEKPKASKSSSKTNQK